MNFDRVLAEAKMREITKKEALFLFRKVQSWDRLLRLFKVANKVRDDEVGPRLKLMGFLCCITRCTTEPKCEYCFRWADEGLFSQEAVIEPEAIKVAVKAWEKRGLKRAELAGGTLWGEEGRRATLEAAKAACSVGSVDIWINNGPSFLPEDVQKLKEVGVAGIACNLETLNKAIFKRLRPGDSYDLRISIIEATKKVGLGIDNTLMIGLGESWGALHPYEDWVDFLFYFKGFKNTRIIEIHPFNPIRNSLCQNMPPGSVLETEKARAIARLVFRDVDISGGNTLLGLLAGANLAMHVFPVTKRFRAWKERVHVKIETLDGDLVLVDNAYIATAAAKELGMEIEQ